MASRRSARGLSLRDFADVVGEFGVELLTPVAILRRM
jgi:hypothetical protein